MPSERYYIDQDTLSENDIIDLQGNEYHHLAHVMRTRVGEEIELVNGRGFLATAIVKKLLKDRAILGVEKSTFSVPEVKSVILAQALPKANRLDFILEKGTELGVSEFWLFPGERSAKKEAFPNQMERMNTIIISAMKQCGRLYLPSIIFKPSISDWPEWHGSAFYGDVNPEAPLFAKAWKESEHAFPILFFVGPEGGFTDREEEEILKRGGKGVKLHRNILRTETAAIVGLSLIAHWLL